MTAVHDLTSVACTRCGTVGRLRVEYRNEYVPLPYGTYSVAGMNPKVSAVHTPWPWMVCDACGADCRGKPADQPEVTTWAET